MRRRIAASKVVRMKMAKNFMVVDGIMKFPGRALIVLYL